jgi:hypothetical protein
MMRIAAVAIVVAVLALAPSGAKAHGGHTHGAAVQQSAPVPVVMDTGSAAQSVTQVTPQLIASGEQPAGQNGCAGTCCKSGTACCVVIFTDQRGTALPSGIATRIAFPQAPSWSSLAPDRLRRPPKSFA